MKVDSIRQRDETLPSHIHLATNRSTAQPDSIEWALWPLGNVATWRHSKRYIPPSFYRWHHHDPGGCSNTPYRTRSKYVGIACSLHSHSLYHRHSKVHNCEHGPHARSTERHDSSYYPANIIAPITTLSQVSTNVLPYLPPLRR